MPNKIHQEFPMQFPMDLYQAMTDLGERRLMTPTYLSMLIMFAVLPAKFLVEKKKPLVNDAKGICSIQSWIARSNLEPDAYYEINKKYLETSKTHTFTSLSVDGLETLEAIHKTPKQQYGIFCCNHAQDAMNFDKIFDHINKNPSKNYIFWNYPGVGSSSGESNSKYNLFKAGYQQAKRLINKNIPAQNITLYGLSIGRGVAAHVTRQLRKEGHLVNLEIDYACTRIAAFIPELIAKKMTNQDNSKQSSYIPLISSTIYLALAGVTLGTAFAGFVASLGLVAASATAAIGYIGASCIQTFGLLLQEIMSLLGEMIAFPFSLLSKAIGDNIKSLFNNIGYCLAYLIHWPSFATNKIFSTISVFIDTAVNLIASIVGGAIAIVGLVAGSLAGLLLGALLSIQLLWTEKPLTIPMTPAFSAVLYSSCCEIDFVLKKYHFNQPETIEQAQPNISKHNVIYSQLISVANSLSMGIFGYKQVSDDENLPFQTQLTQ